MADELVRVEVEPALAPFRLRPGVPADGEGLEPPPGEADQVLLERPDPEGVGDLELLERPVGAVRPDARRPFTYAR